MKIDRHKCTKYYIFHFLRLYLFITQSFHHFLNKVHYCMCIVGCIWFVLTYRFSMLVSWEEIQCMLHLDIPLGSADASLSHFSLLSGRYGCMCFIHEYCACLCVTDRFVALAVVVMCRSSSFCHVGIHNKREWRNTWVECSFYFYRMPLLNNQCCTSMWTKCWISQRRNKVAEIFIEWGPLLNFLVKVRLTGRKTQEIYRVEWKRTWNVYSL